MIRRAWLIFKNFLVHLFKGGEDRIAVGGKVPLEEFERRQREIERQERREKRR